MSALDLELSRRLEALRETGLHRQLRGLLTPQGPQIRVGGQELINFSSNDYLGLANDPRLKAAAVEAVERFGAGAGASRLICGSLAPHQELDETVAQFKGTDAALGFSTGFAAALGAICALMGKEDVIILDKLVHASIVDAARLSGAKLRVFAHNELNELEDILKWKRTTRQTSNSKLRNPNVLIVTESVFSMDGDTSPLEEIVALKEKYGAWLMVDEAHGTGLYGANGRGLAEELGVGGQIEVQMGTLGKALGASGGYICGSRYLIDYLINKARTFIFSTAPVPAAAAAATAGIRFVQSNEGAVRRAGLFERILQLRTALNCSGAGFASAIVPLILGDEAAAVQASASLRERGFFVPAIRYPTVARGQARLRFTVTAAHTSSQITSLIEAVTSLPGPQHSSLITHSPVAAEADADAASISEHAPHSM
jgi:8-amino-7-oxononanoate synthase